MKIRIMKSDALEHLKNNMEVIYSLYYKNSSNKWLWDICEGDPFVDYTVVPDFNLADLTKPKGEIDLENCKIIFKNLLFLNESQACDERLWAGLAHDVFYNYLRERWNMKPADTKKDRHKLIGEIKTRFFFNGAVKAGEYRNTLAKCWWVGRKTYNPDNEFKALDIIGSNDINSKINEIFYNYNFTANPEIFSGIILGLEKINNEVGKYKVKDHLRPTLQYINAIGGGTLLDYWTKEEIRDLFFEKMLGIINGTDDTIITNDTDDYDNDGDIDILTSNEEKEASDMNQEDKEPVVELGDQVDVFNISKDKKSTFNVMFTEINKSELPAIPKATLYKPVGYEFEVGENKYRIISINKNN